MPELAKGSFNPILGSGSLLTGSCNRLQAKLHTLLEQVPHISSEDLFRHFKVFETDHSGLT